MLKVHLDEAAVRHRRADSASSFSAGSRIADQPRLRSGTRISIIHQNQPDARSPTVAQNIYIGREPRFAGFFMSDRGLNQRRPIS